MKVGDAVYYFDQNSRSYAPGAGGSPIYRAYFRLTKITGETKTQWVTDIRGKYNKKPRASIYPEPHSSHMDRLFTEAEVDAAVYRQENRHRLAELVRNEATADTLRAIDELLHKKGATK